MKLTSLIIDDEEISCDALEWQLKKYCPEVEVVQKCSDPLNAESTIKQANPNIVFLDIEMPGMSGLDLLSKFTKPNFHVIFVTAHDKFALKAFKYSAVDYLLKPVESQDLIEAVNKVKDKGIGENGELNLLLSALKEMNSEKGSKRIALPTSNEIAIVNIDDIIYCEGDGNYTSIIMHDGSKIVLSKTLKLLEDFLDERVFFRIHNAYLININHIKKVNRREGGALIMDNGAELPMSRYKKQEFFERFDYL
ncbi:DNA-binding response regulator [Cytophagales bacterium WSM2-2]|nr:DNA-binding response regulator [Cytophagales bacterium WSM2-2]